MKIKTVMLAAAAALLAGCQETAGTRVTIDTTTGESYVMELSSHLADSVKVRGVTYGEVNGVKKATVTIESTVHKRLQLQARMVWLDADGAEMDADAKPFRAIILDGMDITTFTGVAPNERGVTARLQLRETDVAE